MTYFSGTAENPYHLSVGAVVKNPEGKLAVHHFKDVKGVSDYYTFMRETVEKNESIEQALARGIMEEFGMTARFERYLGSLVGNFPAKDGTPIQKTTLYAVMELLTQDENKRSGDDPERVSKIEWHTPDALARIFAAQAELPSKIGKSEGEIIKRLTGNLA